MSRDSVLKKEFKKSDVERVRNIVNKKFDASTKSQTGYRKASERHKEGDEWEESGKTWTVKNGLRQNITKLDVAKKALRMPLACPKCKGSMKHHLAKKMYKIHGFCFDCTIKYESGLRQAGLYEQYEKRMMQGNMSSFADDIEQWALNFINPDSKFVTEQGDVEDWVSNSSEKKKIMDGIKEYTTHLRQHLK